MTVSKSIPPMLITTRYCAGNYRIIFGAHEYHVYRYDDGAWGVYEADANADGGCHEENCVWIESRLKDCKAWISNTHRNI